MKCNHRQFVLGCLMSAALAACGGGGGGSGDSSGSSSSGGSSSGGSSGSSGGAPAPAVTLSANPTSIAWDASSTLTWSTANATSCTASGAWSGAVATSGSQNTGALAASATYTLTCTGSGGSSAKSVTVTVSPPTAGDKIKHVVVIVQENRTPDNLFHGLPGADIANSGTNSQGQIITLQPVNLSINWDLGHRHSDFEAMYDNGKMDGADKIAVTCGGTPPVCPGPDPAFQYVPQAQVQPYFQLAEQYTFGDRMFQTNQGPSFPAHQFIISGTSAPSVGGIYGDYFAAENPTPESDNAGCVLAPKTELVALIDPTGVESVKIWPCFEHPTIMDSLDNAGVSWLYYAPLPGSIWNAPNAIQHLSSGPDWAKVIMPETQVLTDIANGSLPQVSWVIPDGLASDHAMANNGSGPAWVASVVNAIGASPYWSDTAIIITWDDWGGWYDHVPPPSIYNSYEYGFRVPLIIVSPYAKKAYVSHAVHDFGSILNFIEGIFNLPSLGYADARADNFADCFDFSQTATTYAPIASKVGAKYFIERSKHVKPTPPDTD